MDIFLRRYYSVCENIETNDSFEFLKGKEAIMKTICLQTSLHLFQDMFLYNYVCFKSGFFFYIIMPFLRHVFNRTEILVLNKSGKLLINSSSTEGCVVKQTMRHKFRMPQTSGLHFSGIIIKLFTFFVWKNLYNPT